MRRGIAGPLAAALLLAATSWPVVAQIAPFRRDPVGAPPCVLDKCLESATGAPQAQLRPAAPQRRAPPGSGDFDFYVLSLSWSPGYCDSGGDVKSPAQCGSGRHLGFVVHGLWPQNQHGYPSNCDTGARFPSRAALDSVRDVYPDEGLARHEWRAHGTCSGLSPTDYFAAVRQASQAVAVPAAFTNVDAPVTMAPLDVARAFMASNAGLRPDTMAVTCRSGELAEVRVCLAKDLRGYVSCPEVARDACRTRAVTVPPVR